MPSTSDHVEAVAGIIANYRGGDIAPPDAAHVGRWLDQFDRSLRAPLIAELHHVFGQTYLSKSTFEGFFAKQINHKELTGGDPKRFWSRANFFKNQRNGASQRDILKIFDKGLKAALGLSLRDCGGGEVYVYLDDVLFSGNRVCSDLERWIAHDAPSNATVHILLMATHEFGEWQAGKRLKDAAAGVGKAIKFTIWRALNLENRRKYRNSSAVLWPTTIPAEATDYVSAQKPQFEARVPGGATSIFSSEAGRYTLEQAFLIAGMKIRSVCKNPKMVLRPLGFGPFGVGFGSMIVTYRNCPNNAPLALWWGDPTAASSHPFSKWRPLVPRKTYGEDEAFEF